ncbi:hypothetical protein AWC38_SpisGene23604 [Stylophora pistillata]|uniref:Uncharacterized protein n=1 Tax=Stylophora pistillata TaxID=50429 RepID=A0A2B4R7U1_STYPI|nr:hypothetical protein AWC38_SpisGene23604 [Stylophora pistillata]
MDFLGEEGRRARNASVRVSVYKKIKPWQLYNRSEAIGRIRDCNPKDVVNVDLDNVFEVGLDITTLGYDISDIINSLVRLDEKGTDSWVRKCGEEEQEIIQKQRRGVKAEYNDVRENLQLFEHGTGSPVVLLCDSAVVMIGIVKEKQIKRMLTPEEQTFLGRVYEKYNLEGNVDSLTSKDVLSKLEQIGQKLNELEMSFPSGLGNAITGATVQEFLNEASGTY